MSPMPELVPMLKQLRLSGILSFLDLRNRQAIEEKMAYSDFLALILQDEIARRSQKKLLLALRRANFRNHKTLEDFDFSFNPSINRALILDLATCRYIDEKVATFIVGPCGTGKSHLAQALGHCAVRAGYDVLFTTQSKLLSQLNASRAVGAHERTFRKLATVELLIIDDFGLKPLRPPQDEDFHDLVAERYERCSTIVTSNLDLPEWLAAFPNRLLGAATIDRLQHGAYKVILEGDSYRSPRPLPKTTRKSVAKGGENP